LEIPQKKKTLVVNFIVECFMKNIEIIPNKVQLVKVGNFEFKALGDSGNHFYMTIKELAKVFETKEDTINTSINRNIDEFEIGIDYDMGYIFNYDKLSELDMISNNAKNTKLLSKSGVILVGMLLRKSQKAKEFRRLAKHIIVKATKEDNQAIDKNINNYLLEANIQKDKEITILKEQFERELDLTNNQVIRQLKDLGLYTPFLERDKMIVIVNNNYYYNKD
jgi:hypothetical protein